MPSETKKPNRLAMVLAATTFIAAATAVVGWVQLSAEQESNHSLTQQHVALKAEYQNAQNRLADAAGKLGIAAGQIDTLVKERDGLGVRLAEAQKNYTEANNRFKDMLVERDIARTELADLKDAVGDRDAIKADADALRQQLEQAKGDLAAEQQKLASLQEDHAKTVAAFQQEITALQQARSAVVPATAVDPAPAVVPAVDKAN